MPPVVSEATSALSPLQYCGFDKLPDEVLVQLFGFSKHQTKERRLSYELISKRLRYLMSKPPFYLFQSQWRVVSEVPELTNFTVHSADAFLQRVDTRSKYNELSGAKMFIDGVRVADPTKPSDKKNGDRRIIVIAGVPGGVDDYQRGFEDALKALQGLPESVRRPAIEALKKKSGNKTADSPVGCAIAIYDAHGYVQPAFPVGFQIKRATIQEMTPLEISKIAKKSDRQRNAEAGVSDGPSGDAPAGPARQQANGAGAQAMEAAWEAAAREVQQQPGPAPPTKKRKKQDQHAGKDVAAPIRALVLEFDDNIATKLYIMEYKAENKSLRQPEIRDCSPTEGAELRKRVLNATGSGNTWEKVHNLNRLRAPVTYGLSSDRKFHTFTDIRSQKSPMRPIREAAQLYDAAHHAGCTGLVIRLRGWRFYHLYYITPAGNALSSELYEPTKYHAVGQKKSLHLRFKPSSQHLSRISWARSNRLSEVLTLGNLLRRYSTTQWSTRTDAVLARAQEQARGRYDQAKNTVTLRIHLDRRCLDYDSEQLRSKMESGLPKDTYKFFDPGNKKKVVMRDHGDYFSLDRRNVTVEFTLPAEKLHALEEKWTELVSINDVNGNPPGTVQLKILRAFLRISNPDNKMVEELGKFCKSYDWPEVVFDTDQTGPCPKKKRERLVGNAGVHSLGSAYLYTGAFSCGDDLQKLSHLVHQVAGLPVPAPQAPAARPAASPPPAAHVGIAIAHPFHIHDEDDFGDEYDDDGLDDDDYPYDDDDLMMDYADIL